MLLTLSDAMDRSPPGSSVHGVFQARVLEWGVLQDLIGSVSLPGSNCIVPLNLHSQGKKQKRIQVKRAHQPACLIPNLEFENLIILLCLIFWFHGGHLEAFL